MLEEYMVDLPFYPARLPSRNYRQGPVTRGRDRPASRNDGVFGSGAWARSPTLLVRGALKGWMKVLGPCDAGRAECWSEAEFVCVYTEKENFGQFGIGCAC